MQFESLIGIPWQYEMADCFALMRKFYSLNWGIEVPDVAHPLGWETRNPELDLIRTNFRSFGFMPVDVNPRTILAGDLLLMQHGPGVKAVNHCGAYLGAGWFLHQVFREKSEKTLWAGAWRDKTMIVARHPKVAVRYGELDLMEFLSPAKRNTYRAALSKR